MYEKYQKNKPGNGHAATVEQNDPPGHTEDDTLESEDNAEESGEVSGVLEEETESEIKSDLETETEVETESESATITESETESELETESETTTESATDTESETIAETETGTETETLTESLLLSGDTAIPADEQLGYISFQLNTIIFLLLFVWAERKLKYIFKNFSARKYKD